MKANAVIPHPAMTSMTAMRELGEHRARWLLTGDQAFEHMVRAIDEEPDIVRLESYMLKPGAPATRIMNALLRALGRRAQVHVLVDAFGSERLPKGFFAALEEAGAHVLVFNPRRLLRLTFRNHRKLLVCGQRVAFVGGFNIGPEYEGDGIHRGYYDLGLELRGPIVRDLANSFDRMCGLAPFTAQTLREFRDSEVQPAASSKAVRLLESGPGCARGSLRRSLYRDLRRANDVSVIAGYFLPSRRIRRELARTVWRGGRVSLLLAGLSDVLTAKYAGENLYGELLGAGTRIHEYQPQVLHAKLLVIDDVLYIGSCNLDRRSLHINYELLVRLEWPQLAEDARAIFGKALLNSRRIRHSSWRRYMGFWQRVRSKVAYWLLARLDPLIANRKFRLLG